MTDINHNKRLSEVFSHAKCPRDGSRDLEAISYAGNNYTLKCKYCMYEWTESWRPSMAKENKPSSK